MVVVLFVCSLRQSERFLLMQKVQMGHRRVRVWSLRRCSCSFKASHLTLIGPSAQTWPLTPQQSQHRCWHLPGQQHSQWASACFLRTLSRIFHRWRCPLSCTATWLWSQASRSQLQRPPRTPLPPPESLASWQMLKLKRIKMNTWELWFVMKTFRVSSEWMNSWIQSKNWNQMLKTF